MNAFPKSLRLSCLTISRGCIHTGAPLHVERRALAKSDKYGKRQRYYFDGILVIA